MERDGEPSTDGSTGMDAATVMAAGAELASPACPPRSTLWARVNGNHACLMNGGGMGDGRDAESSS